MWALVEDEQVCGPVHRAAFWGVEQDRRAGLRAWGPGFPVNTFIFWES